MQSSSRLFKNSLMLGAIFLASVTAMAVDTGGESTHIVLRMTRHMGLVAGSDASSHVVVWEDGAVDIHYPAFMKRAGDYRLRLSDAELDALMSDMIAGGLPEFDPALLREELAHKAVPSDGAGRVVSWETDRGFTVIEYRLPATEDKGFVEGSARWTGLQSSARRHVDVSALQDLARIERRLLDLADDSRAVRVGQ